jgi:ABC-2 type transport system ATP-binding protein
MDNMAIDPATRSGTPAAARAGGRAVLPAIDIASLTKVYDRGKGAALTAVDAISLAVLRGQVIGLLGPNGAGKTTTIKMICGLVTPTSGTVQVNGYDVARQRSLAVRQIGAVLEGARNVYWSLSAWQNLLYFGRLKGLPSRLITPRAEWLLRELDLWDRRHQPVGGFSRGMQQKVAIAAAMIADPPILLLDEPTIGLDVQAARTVRGWITKVAREQGKTIVLTTHQLALAQELSDRVAIIRQGHIVADLPTTGLLAHFRQDLYEIRLSRRPKDVPPWLPVGFVVEETDDAGATLRGPVPDHEGLYGLLEQLRARDLQLVSIKPVEPNLEDVFLRLVGEA